MNPEKFRPRPEIPSEEEGHQEQRQETGESKETEEDKLWDARKWNIGTLVQLENDPHRERVINLIEKAEDPMILERFLDDNRERLSPTVQRALEPSIAWNKFQRGEKRAK